MKIDNSINTLNRVASDLFGIREDYRREFNSLKEQNKKLREYTIHHTNCPKIWGKEIIQDCTCGLEELLKNEEK